MRTPNTTMAILSNSDKRYFAQAAAGGALATILAAPLVWMAVLSGIAIFAAKSTNSQEAKAGPAESDTKITVDVPGTGNTIVLPSITTAGGGASPAQTAEGDPYFWLKVGGLALGGFLLYNFLQGDKKQDVVRQSDDDVGNGFRVPSDVVLACEDLASQLVHDMHLDLGPNINARGTYMTSGLSGWPYRLHDNSGFITDKPGRDLEMARLAIARDICEVMVTCVVAHVPPNSLESRLVYERTGNPMFLNDEILAMLEPLSKRLAAADSIYVVSNGATDLKVGRNVADSVIYDRYGNLYASFGDKPTAGLTPTGSRDPNMKIDLHPFRYRGAYLMKAYPPYDYVAPAYQVTDYNYQGRAMPRPLIRGLHPQMEQMKDESCECAHDCAYDKYQSNYAFQQDADTALAGRFYSSPTFTAAIASLPDGEYGEVELARLPFEIKINSKNTPDRNLVALVHETLHGYDKLHKLGINHDQLHSLSVFLTAETIPAYMQLKQVLKSS